ncbi:hypothetical protein GCM10009765_17850 [Fodinicola feengrottensis]|uniref:Conjugal transfer protein n=1 Tax=Fodinicola feengrottensis TaxID=435914 RepID=A0ABN2GC18_9ACTN
MYVPPPASGQPEVPAGKPKGRKAKQAKQPKQPRQPRQKKGRQSAAQPPPVDPNDPGFQVQGGTVVPTGAARKRRSSPLAGGRWMQFAVKTLIVVVLAVIALNGVYRLAGKALYDPPTAPAGSNFPTQAASAYATRFAQAYFSWDENNPQNRSTALQPFFPSTTNLQLGWDGKGVQQVIGSPIPAGVSASDDQHAVVQLTAYLSPGGWTCMQVGVFSPNRGQTLAITSYTAYVACPAAAPVTVPNVTDEDGTLEAQLSPVLNSFFRAYGASSSDLPLTLSTGSTVTGLAGSVKLVSVDRVIVPTATKGADPNQRVATVNVSWQTPSGGVLAQSYQVTLIKVDRWGVLSLAGGAPSSDIAPQQGGVAPNPSGNQVPATGQSPSAGAHAGSPSNSPPAGGQPSAKPSGPAR